MEELIVNTIQNDRVVKLLYSLSVDGEELEANALEYLHGHDNIIVGLENALTGLQPGETKDILVTADEAYGEYDPQAVVNVTRSSFPPDFEILLGEPMRLRDAQGHIFSGVATALTDDNVELDLNHPLAGKDLLFNVTVLNIREASEIELEAGMVQSACSSCGDGGCGDGCCC